MAVTWPCCRWWARAANFVVINLETREPKVITPPSEFDVMSVR